jgi:hypothetical protein
MFNANNFQGFADYCGRHREDPHEVRLGVGRPFVEFVGDLKGTAAEGRVARKMAKSETTGRERCRVA